MALHAAAGYRAASRWGPQRPARDVAYAVSAGRDANQHSSLSDLRVRTGC